MMSRFSVLVAFFLVCLLAGGAYARENTAVNNEVALQIRVERAGRLWSLADIAALRYGDLLHVRLSNAKGYRPEFPHVANQRVNSMPPDHGLMAVGAFVRATDRSGLGPEAFARPFLARDGSEWLFRVERDDVTPFILLVPAIYDGKRDGDWKDLTRDIAKKPELKPLRDFLLRDFEAASVGGEVSLAFNEGDDPDNSLKVAQFLLPRISAANALRSQPSFQQMTRSQQTEQLYTALGTTLPDKPGAYDYVNQFLDAFVPADPTQPVKSPNASTLGALLQGGIAFLPQWYTAPLRGLEIVGKLGELLMGLNSRPRKDEQYFVSVRWTPKATATTPTPTAAAADPDVFAMDPVERLDEKGKDGRRRKNILIACLGKTTFKKAVVKPTLAAANSGGVVYLSNTSQTRVLTLDAASPVSPDQLARLGSGLSLQLADGSPPIALAYDKKAGTFRLESARPLPAHPVNAVLRGDWGHNDAIRDLTLPFQVCGVERGAWTLENGSLLTVGGSATVRLRTAQPIRPLSVIFRYATGAAITAQEVSEVPGEPGVYAVRFDLAGQRAGRGRLEIVKPPADSQPDITETFRDPAGTELPVQLFDPLRPLASDDLRYYAYDSRLLLRAGAFTDASSPTRITLGDKAFERGPTLDDGWIAYDGKEPFTRPGPSPAALALRDGRTLNAEVRVRPRRPAFTVAERLTNMPPSPFPWELPDRVATQYSALEIRLTAQEGYRFPSTAALYFGPIKILPDILPTGAAGVDSITFTLDPRTYPNLRGQLVGRLTETRDNSETISSPDIALTYTLVQLPDLPVSLRYQNGKYRLYAKNAGVFERAGAVNALVPVMATNAGPVDYIEFAAPPGMPLAFQPRMTGGNPLGALRWLGPIAPATPGHPAAEYSVSGAQPSVTLRWERAAGATEYQIFRATDAAVPVTPPNRIANVPATDAANFTYTDGAPLEPGTVYHYRIIAVNRLPGYDDKSFPEADFIAATDPTGPVLTRPANPATVAVTEAKAGEKTVVEVRFGKAAGATAYRVYRGTAADFTPAPENKVADVPPAGDTLTWQDTAPLTPGVTYFYKVVAIAAREGIRETVSPPSPPSNGYAVPK